MQVFFTPQPRLIALRAESGGEAAWNGGWAGLPFMTYGTNHARHARHRMRWLPFPQPTKFAQ